MRFIVFLAASGLSVALPAAASVAAAQASAGAPTEAELLAAGEALAALDEKRLGEDRDYARAILLHAERVSAESGTASGDDSHLGKIRMVALGTLGRHSEALVLGQAMVAAGTTDPWIYALSLYEAAYSEDETAAVQIAEAGAARIPAGARGEFRDAVAEEVIQWAFQRLHAGKNNDGLQRLASALLTLDHAKADDAATRDFYRQRVIERHMDAGRIAEARAVAKQISAPRSLTTLLVTKRYDPLFDAATDRRQLIRASLAAYDASTKKYLQTAPGDLRYILERGQALRMLGREQEALSVLLPVASDLKRVEAGGDKAFWIVNEAAQALGDLGRHDEAVTLVEKLVALGLDKHPDLISMAINQGEVLNAAGRYKEAAAHEAKMALIKEGASPFGYMWMWSMAACAHLLDGDAAGARLWLNKLAENSADNQAAHMRALLCANDLDAAEKLLIARLKGDNFEGVLLNLQTFELGEIGSESEKVVKPRLLALRERPAVREAIAGVGRILSLPLSRTYFGDY